MCRWAAYIGEPIFLEEIISKPGRSLIHQSLHAKQCSTGTNGDGFGLAWYGERSEPGIYRDITPAWSDPNLISLAHLVKSHLFLAHVRASTGTATSRNNCHPFRVGRWSFMHNGQIGGFEGLRQKVDGLVPADLYPFRKGATDSEALFLLALGAGLDRDPHQALATATAQLEEMSRQNGSLPHMRLTAAFSDGETLFAVRYASDNEAPTLYFRYSAALGGYAVVSEPLEQDNDDWTAVPQGSFVTFSGKQNRVERFAPFGALHMAI